MEYQPIRDGRTIVLGDDRECAVVGEGTILAERLIDGAWKSARIERVLHVPEMGKNLYSVGQAMGETVTFYHDAEPVVVGVKQSNMVYRMLLRVIEPHRNEANAASLNLQVWHKRLGHLNVRALEEITSKGLIEGIKLQGNTELVCENCQLGKSHKLPFTKEVQRNTEPGEMIHTDVCGPMKDTSLGGARFFAVFKDNASGFRHVYFLKHKGDVFERFVIYEKEIRNKFGRPMRRLRSDNGREYVNERMTSYLQSLGIVHELTAPYTPEQNGKAERDNRTIVECAQTLLNAKGLPGFLWAEAVNAAVYLLNRVSTCPRERETKPRMKCGRSRSLTSVT